MMLERLEQRTRDLGFRHIYLDVLDNQHGAHRLFKNSGYLDASMSSRSRSRSPE